MIYDKEDIMSSDDYIRFNVEKWKKALRIAEIRADKICTYEQAEKIYNDEQNKKDKQNQSAYPFIVILFL